MRKKVLSLILLWAALLALALIYTDRDEYTWRYEGGELAQIVITREEADARQKQADEAMALMQQAAQARTDAGLWGSENEWEDDFLPAQGENGGLNLMWGDYQATIEYEDAARMDAHVVSAGYQAFIENGDAHDEAEAENILLHRLSFVFRLTDSTPNLYLASENPEAIRAVTVHKVGAGVLYTLCIYRLVNVYSRATLGESLAMVFFPVVMLGLYEVLRRDERKWPLLALGMTGVCMSHLLSTMFCVLFCAIAALASAGKLLARKRRILAVLAAAGVTALCALWFFVPMMQYTADGISTSVVLNSSEYVHRLGSFLVGFAGDVKADAPEDFAYTIGVVPGLALLIGCALLLARRYAAGRAEMRTENDRLALGLLALGALALGLSTDFFPWRTLCSIRKPFSTFFMQIQFPWRFVGMAVPMLSAAAAWGYLREERDAKTGMAALIALCVVFSGYTMQTMVQRLPELEKETYTDTRIGQFEYTYPCTEKTALKVGDVRTSQPGVCSVLSYEKRGTELTATVQLEGEAAYIELPLLYYPGYRAEIDGQAQTVARGTNNMVRVYGLSSGESGTVHVWYQPPTAWLIAQGASVLGALLLAASLRRMRRRA